jgi:hypothetical protein
MPCPHPSKGQSRSLYSDMRFLIDLDTALSTPYLPVRVTAEQYLDRRQPRVIANKGRGLRRIHKDTSENLDKHEAEASYCSRRKRSPAVSRFPRPVGIRIGFRTDFCLASGNRDSGKHRRVTIGRSSGSESVRLTAPQSPSYTMRPHQNTRGGNNVESRERTSGASREAQPSANGN